MPHFVLLGGLIHERLFTRAGVMEFIKMPRLDDQRAQLVASLNLKLAEVSNTLQTPVSSLSRALSQHASPPSDSPSS